MSHSYVYRAPGAIPEGAEIIWRDDAGTVVAKVDSASRTLLAVSLPCGRRVEIKLGYDSSYADWRDQGRIRWSEPLPATDQAGILAYAAPVLEGKRDACLLHVASVDADGFDAHAVATPRSPGYVPDSLSPDEPACSEIGAARFGDGKLRFKFKAPSPSIGRRVAEPLAALPSPGDLLAAADISCKIVDGSPVFRASVLFRVASNVSRHDVGAMLPGEDPHDGGWLFSSPYETTFDVLDEAESLGRASLDPDEALVLFHDDGDGDLACAVLATSGRTFHHCDDVQAYVEFGNPNPGPGLWLLHDAKWWAHTSYEGEHDSGIEGSYRPATEADVSRHGFTFASLDDEIAGYLEIDPRPGLGAEAIATAEARAAVADPVPVSP